MGLLRWFYREFLRSQRNPGLSRLDLGDGNLSARQVSTVRGGRRGGQAYGVKWSKFEDGKGFVMVRLSDGQRLSWRTLPQGEGIEAANIVGVSHYEGIRHAAFDPGMRLTLRPEPENPADPNAIAVWNDAGTMQVGYLPADVAKRLAKPLKAGTTYRCVSMWEQMAGRKRVGLRVLLIRGDLRIEGLR